MNVDVEAVVGCTDGFRQGYVEGWAWRPARPHDTVVVQLFVDGTLFAEATACLPRPDLSTAGIGHGQHAFAIPFTITPGMPEVLHFCVRVKDGAVLPDGEFDLETSAEARAASSYRRSLGDLEKIFGSFTADRPPAARLAPAAPSTRLNFVLYSARGSSPLANSLGMPEYSYVPVMQGFREILRRLGAVHVVRDPAEAEPIYAACLARAESCVLLSFAPPQSTRLGLRCPTIPVIAWEFGTIPTGGWPGDAREDWSMVLRQTGRAITISDFAARAVRAQMGGDYPVAFLPTPVWDRLASLRARLGVAQTAELPELRLDGFVWDSRLADLSIDRRTAPMPEMPRRATPPRLPMHGASLELALASEACQAAVAAAAKAAAEAALEAKNRAAAEAILLAEAAAAAARQEAEAQAARAAAERAASLVQMPRPDKSFRQRVGVTLWMARQWYREVLRDVVPRPLARLLSTAGRVAVALRPPRLEPDRVEASDPHPELQIPPPPDGTGPEADSLAAAGTDVTPQSEPPATARYLPVDESADASTLAPPPRYLPAPDAAPLAMPDLAAFDPDPYPLPPAATECATVRVEGVVFTCVLSPKDGRKNWQDIVTAFAAAFREVADATLVMKMIGNDPAYWWWEFNGIVKALPPFACRIVAISGYLDEENYQALISASHFVVNASLAEGQCLPLVEFMSGGRPAIAPLHTAMLDYITPDNAIIVASEMEFCSWPHDPRNHLTTTRYRIEWPSLRDAFTEAWRILHEAPGQYASMQDAAAASMRAYCADDVVGPRLAAFLGLGDAAVRRAGWTPLARAPAEPMLAPAELAP